MLEISRINSDLTGQLNSSLVPELNIYNQAYLILNRPLVKTELVKSKTSQEIPLSFEVQGEINGYVICYLDLEHKNIPPQNLQLFQSLYVESMNIALGKLFTNLEYNSSIQSLINEPNLGLDKIKLIEERSSYLDKYSWSYKLVSQIQEFECRMMLLLKKEK